MKDLNNFCKLFNINVPVAEHADYYFDRLAESGYKSDIYELVDTYTEYEATVNEPHGHKMASMQKLINVIKQAPFFTRFNEDPEVTKELADYKIEGVNTYANHADHEGYFLSIDLVKANYQILKSYDDEDILKSSWDDFLDSQHINPIFKLSKPFRQHVFGNLNPKRTQRHQAIIMDKLSKTIYTEIPNGLELVMKTYDELIYKVNREDILLYKFDKFTSYNIKQTAYSLIKIGKDKYIKDDIIYNPEGDNYVKTEFKGVEGNMFYMYLRKYILDSTNYDDRDLYFMENKRIAKWVDTL